MNEDKKIICYNNDKILWKRDNVPGKHCRCTNTAFCCQYSWLLSIGNQSPI